jgi:IS5 family transposase
LNDTIVLLLPPHPLEVTVLRESDPQTTIWELLLPEELKRLPAELARVDAYLDDERFIAPFRALFDRRLGRPSVPVESLLRLLYLRHRYQLGYEGLCREVSDSIGWRRFYRSGWRRRCRTRPPWSSWYAAPARRRSRSSTARCWTS